MTEAEQYKVFAADVENVSKKFEKDSDTLLILRVLSYLLRQEVASYPPFCMVLGEAIISEIARRIEGVKP